MTNTYTSIRISNTPGKIQLGRGATDKWLSVAAKRGRKGKGRPDFIHVKKSISQLRSPVFHHIAYMLIGCIKYNHFRNKATVFVHCMFDMFNV